MSKEDIEMSAEAVTARIKRPCELGNFTRALISARSAAARERLEGSNVKKYQPKAESSKRERE
jgi:hypothetical protein